MGIHNICFYEEIRKNISPFSLKKKPYLEEDLGAFKVYCLTSWL